MALCSGKGGGGGGRWFGSLSEGSVFASQIWGGGLIYGNKQNSKTILFLSIFCKSGFLLCLL